MMQNKLVIVLFRKKIIQRKNFFLQVFILNFWMNIIKIINHLL